MTKRILIQLDSDLHPSSFDSIVAIDSGVDHLLRYNGVQATSVQPIVHGAMFTRGGDDLRHTALFIGGSDVNAAERLLSACKDSFFGSIRVSLMLDANGCNTTASAAVVTAGRHCELADSKAVILGGTGPVGRRVAQLLASNGTQVAITSRSLERAQSACNEVLQKVPDADVIPLDLASGDQLAESLQGVQIVIGCGAPGIQLIDEKTLASLESLRVVIDLNAVPPSGIGGLAVTDKAAPLGHGVGYGAIGVGGLKMKIHRAAIRMLFESNDRVLETEEIYAIAKSIGE